jgi:type IV secretory pathway VirB2 component (pilin)
VKTIYRVGLGFALAATPMLAGTVGGGVLQIEGPITKFGNSISGPVAYGIVLMGVAIAGGSHLIDTHADLGTLGKVGARIGVFGGIALGASPMLASVFGTSGAVI